MKAIPKTQILFILASLTFILVLATIPRVYSFVERKYTLDEVIAESTNIVFGTIASADKQRRRLIIEVDEDIKGKSGFTEIKINYAVGQQEKFMKKMNEKANVSSPIIIFYKKSGANIDSLGHVGGTWFQTRAVDQKNRSKVWWSFTHIEIYMHRTYKGSTPDFQQLIRQKIGGKNTAARRTKNKRKNIVNTARRKIRKQDNNVSELENKINQLHQEFNTIQQGIDQLQKDAARSTQRLKSRRYDDVPSRTSTEQVLSNESNIVVSAPSASGTQLDDTFNAIQARIKQYQQEMEREFSASRAELQSLERRLDRFEQSIEETRDVFPKLQRTPDTESFDKYETAYEPASTPNVVVDIDQNAINVLVLAGAHFNAEFPLLSQFTNVANQLVVYRRTQDYNLPNLEHVDILWLGYQEIPMDKYAFDAGVEQRIINFVADGGVVIVSGQDSGPNMLSDVGWIPEPIIGVDRPTRSDFQTTKDAGTLFTTPNIVVSGHIFIDDTWTTPSPKYTVLATTNDRQDIAVAMLKHSRGMYLITGLHNPTRDDAAINTPIMENLIHFAVTSLMEKGQVGKEARR